VVIGDATRDDTLREAGIEHAHSLIAALDGDAENLFVTLSGRDLRPDLFIVARARADESIPKLEHAGADRVVNPQELGAARMAGFVASPNVAEFLDVVMHDDDLEWRLEEIAVHKGSELSERTLEEADLRRRCGVMVLALRRPGGELVTNPDHDTVLGAGTVLIAMGTPAELGIVDRLAYRS
jgi:voltage-gated potassium channel